MGVVVGPGVEIGPGVRIGAGGPAVREGADACADADPGAPGGAGPGTGPVLVACDLDGTVLHSARGLGLGGGPVGAGGAAPDGLLVVEHLDGRPQSFVTPAAGRAWAELASCSVLVPATTRTRAQYARVRLPGPPPAFAVTTNGAQLLVDGQPDAAWARTVARACADAAALAEVHARLTAGAAAWTRTSRVAEEAFCYSVVERDALPGGWAAELAGWCAARGWRVSVQGRKVYCLPAALTKAAAVAEVAARVGASRLLAAGDSLLDADLLLAADAGIRPAEGELAATGWAAPHVAVASRTGAQGAQEVVEWLLAAARAWGADGVRGGLAARGAAG